MSATAAFALACAMGLCPDSPLLVQIAFAHGRVSLRASGALVSEVLTEWGRRGGAEVAGLESLGPRRVSLLATGRDESELLAEVLGVGFGFAGAARTEALPTASRFVKIIVTAADVAAAPAPPADLPPEARFSYSVPGKGRILPGLEAAASAPTADLPPAPEAVFEYFQPPRSLPPGTVPDLPVQDLPVSISAPTPPERLHGYFTPPRLSPAQDASPQPAPPGTTGPRAVAPPDPRAPEARFQYFVPARSRPPVPEGDKPGQE